ncbi:MAG: hypothetical protein ACTSPG_02765 [Candidatus Hodarchaeales archaeon]
MMNSYYYLERQLQGNKSQSITLGAFTGNTFYPTIPFDVLEILIKEAKFTIKDDVGNSFSLESFQEKIGHTFTSNPQLIELTAS